MTRTRGSVENSHGESAKGLWARVAGGAIAAAAALALVVGVGSAGAAPVTASEPHKSYVCKYVSKPGQAERLQTGRNPIWVDNHSLLGYDGTVEVGQEFKDGQFRSVVIVANTPKLDPEPSVADCPPAAPPTTTPPLTTPTTPPVTTTTPPVTTTTGPPATHMTPPATTPTPVPSTYPLQPVMGGAAADVATSQLAVTPVQALLVLLALVGLLLALGVRLPRVMRPGVGDKDA